MWRVLVPRVLPPLRKTFTSTTRWAVHEHALDMQKNKQEKKKALTYKLQKPMDFNKRCGDHQFLSLDLEFSSLRMTWKLCQEKEKFN